MWAAYLMAMKLTTEERGASATSCSINASTDKCPLAAAACLEIDSTAQRSTAQHEKAQATQQTGAQHL
jgi:hypothetical protein